MGKAKAKQNKAKDVETKPAKLSLSVKDRLAFRELLPREGDIVSQVLWRDMGEKVQFNQAEIKKIGLKAVDLKTTGSTFAWNPKAKAVSITFTNPEIILLRAQVDRLDKEKKITVDMLELCLKIRGN